MRLKEAIAQADAVRLNTMDEAQKVRLLRELDGELLEMFAADAPACPPVENDSEDAAEKWPSKNTWPEEDPELLMPFPHDGVYVRYLCAQIDLYNMEESRYQNDMEVYNTAMSEARAWWRRNHPPRRSGKWRMI